MAAPSQVTANSLSSSEIEVSWDTVPWKLSNGHLLGYEVMPLKWTHFGVLPRVSFHWKVSLGTASELSSVSSRHFLTNTLSCVVTKERLIQLCQCPCRKATWKYEDEIVYPHAKYFRRIELELYCEVCRTFVYLGHHPAQVFLGTP